MVEEHLPANIVKIEKVKEELTDKQVNVTYILTHVKKEPNEPDDKERLKEKLNEEPVIIKVENPKEVCAKNLRIYDYNRPAIHKCRFCDERFGNTTSKWRHEKRFHSAPGSITPKNAQKPKPGKFECPICGKIMSYAASLWRHKNKVHSEDRPYMCSMCDQAFKLLEHLKRHLSHHLEERSYVCDICGAAFNVKYHLNRHLKRHEGITRYDCCTCKKGFFDRHTRDKHEKTHAKKVRAQNDRKFLCKKCGLGFVSSHSLGVHKENRHGEKMDVPHRNLRSEKLRAKKVHSRLSPPRIETEHVYQCDVCSKVMSSSAYLVQHMKSHTGENDMKCEICHKVIKGGKKSFISHMWIHTGDKPYKCSHCDKRSSCKSWMSRHENSHTKEKIYSCPFCDRDFYDPALRSRHVKIHTRTAQYKCKKCSRSFRRNDHLKRHQLTHSEFRAFQCNHCEKSYKEKKAALVHIRLIHELKGSTDDYKVATQDDDWRESEDE